MNDPDFIIIGAGAAGCALAARLSANPANRVLLIEAGPDLAPGAEPPDVRDPFPGALGGAEFTWPGLTAEVFAASPERAAVRRNFIQGKVVGGSSTINGMMAQRGLPADYDHWESRGATGWGWQGVLPYFNALEADQDFSGPLHGANGPIPIRREKKADWAPFATAVTEAMLARGYPYFEDFNADFRDGVAPVPLNNLPDRRVSASMGYLDATTRRRANLRILPGTLATGLVCDGSSVVGVTIQGAQGPGTLRARETIVCGGAVHSAALLLRSGIGPADEIARLGIPVVADRPGVGRNLLNHLMVHVATHLPRRAMQARGSASWAFTVLRYSSGVEGCTPGDMQIFPINRTAWHSLGRRIGAIGLCLYKPFSVGSVTLASADPRTPPEIRFNMLADERDVRRLVDGLKRVFDLLADERVARQRNDVFMPNKAAAGRLATRTLANRVKTAAIDAAFGAPWLRRALLGASVVQPASLRDDEAALRRIVRDATAHVHHVCGTCRIGAADDAGAVVDPQCRVYGVRGLRIADTSVMPSNISANTHLAAMMIGEKVAAMMLDTPEPPPFTCSLPHHKGTAMQNTFVLTETRGKIGLITLNKPAKLNAWDREMRNDIIAALRRYDADPACGAVVITGTGERAFCAGQDFAEAHDFDEDGAEAWIREWEVYYSTLRGLSKPIIAALNGTAAGSAFQVVLLCDIRVGHDDVKMGQPEINTGIASITGPWIMKEALGMSRAVELTLTGRMMDAAEAERIGILHHVVPRGEVLAKALEIAEEMANKAPVAMRLDRAWLRDINEASFRDMITYAIRAHRESYRTGEPVRKMEEFMAQRGHTLGA